MVKTQKFDIPKEVTRVTETLQNAGFEAYLVGGCVRELLRGQKEPKDWDVTTNAKPDDIIKLFNNTFYENNYGTVGVVIDEWKKKIEDISRETPNDTVTYETHLIENMAKKDEDEDDFLSDGENTQKTSYVIEVTPYRLEATYSDNRHPDSVSFSNSLTDDLKRRDFTINAIAYDPSKGHIIDPYKGQVDIEKKIIMAVGEPEDRFAEDALRMMRAARLATELGFTIEEDTLMAIKVMSNKIQNVSMERIRDEFSRIIMSDTPMEGIMTLHQLEMFQYIIPELENGIGVEQNAAHAFHVWEHNLRSLQHGANKKWPLKIRLAALLHDVSKPETRYWSDKKKNWTFYGHDVVGARVAEKIMKRLKYPKELTEDVRLLVRYHLFFSDTEVVSNSAVRRIVRSVGQKNIWDLMRVRACDRIGTGRPKEQPYRLRKYHAMVEEVMRDPISVGALKITGNKIMQITKEKPGPRIGWMLHALLEEVLDEPKKNTEKYLEERTKILFTLSDKELETLGRAAKEKKEETEEAEVKEIRKRHWVE